MIVDGGAGFRSSTLVRDVPDLGLVVRFDVRAAGSAGCRGCPSAAGSDGGDLDNLLESLIRMRRTSGAGVSESRVSACAAVVDFS